MFFISSFWPLPFIPTILNFLNLSFFYFFIIQLFSLSFDVTELDVYGSYNVIHVQSYILRIFFNFF